MPAPIPSRRPPVRACLALLAAACLSAACASSDPQGDWWAVRASGSGTDARLLSISHVNHGKPPREATVAPRLLREVARGNVSVAVYHDAAIAPEWSGSAWKFGREMDKALDWLERVAGPAGARVVVTLVDDAHALDTERSHAAHPRPVVDLHVPVDGGAASQSALVGRALATGLHEAAHGVAATATPRGGRHADEYGAALVEACYLLDTLRPGDVLELRIDDRHGVGDDFSAIQSRSASTTLVREMRKLANGPTLRADDPRRLAPLRARCGLGR